MTSLIARRGMTLLEVLINLVILALVSSVATLALRPATRRETDARSMLDDSLTAAIAQSRVITITLPLDGRLVSATAFPDGSIDADSTFHLAPIYVR